MSVKKIALAVGVVIVAGAAGVPYVSGTMIARQLQPGKPMPGFPSGVNWTVDSFQRGYLHSTATSTLIMMAPTGALTIHLKHEISQIPGLDGRIATVRTVLAPDDASRKQIAQIYGKQEPLVLTTAITPTGRAHTDIAAAPATYQGLAFSGADGTFDLADEGAYSYRLTASSLTYDGHDPASPGPFAAKGFSATGRGRMDANGIAWNGGAAFKLESASGRFGSLSGIGVNSHSARAGDAVTAEVTFRVASGHFADAPAPLSDIHNLTARYALSGLDAPAAEQIIQQLRKAQAQQLSDPDQVQQLLAPVMMAQLPALLDRGPKLELSPVSVTLPDGTATLHLTLALPPGHGKESMANPMLLMTLATAQGDLSLPETLVDAIAGSPLAAAAGGGAHQQIDAVVQQGYATRTNGMLASSFSFKDGKLTINGKPADALQALLDPTTPD